MKLLTPPIRAAATVEGILPHAVVLLEAEKAGFKLTDGRALAAPSRLLACPGCSARAASWFSTV